MLVWVLVLLHFWRRLHLHLLLMYLFLFLKLRCLIDSSFSYKGLQRSLLLLFLLLGIWRWLIFFNSLWLRLGIYGSGRCCDRWAGSFDLSRYRFRLLFFSWGACTWFVVFNLLLVTHLLKFKLSTINNGDNCILSYNWLWLCFWGQIQGSQEIRGMRH